MGILVTGSQGLVGSRFTEIARDRHDLIHVNRRDGIDILDDDNLIAQVKSLSDPSEIDTIVHLAAFTDVSGAHLQSADRSGDCYRVNVEGTGNVIRLANYCNAHLLYCSTDFVFDGKEEKPLREDDPPKPIEWYGETKLMGEELVQRDADSWNIFRIAFPYLQSPGPRLDLVQNIITKLEANETLFLFGDQVITPTFIDDISRGILHMVEVKPRGEIFHLTGGESLSPLQLGEHLAFHLGVKDPNIVETSMVEYLKQDPRPRQQFSIMDHSKYACFCEEYGFDIPRSISSVFPCQSNSLPLANSLCM